MNIAQVIEQQARMRPHAVALIEGDMLLSYGALGAAVRNAAAWLRREGIAPKDFVGITMGQSAAHLIVVLALARLGAVSVPVHSSFPPETRRALCERYRVRVLISNRSGVAPEGVSQLLVDPSVFRPTAGAGEPVPVTGGDQDIWRLGLSSGTTGVPKAIAITHGQFLRATWLQDVLPATRLRPRLLSFMDMNASAGFSPCARQLLTGRTVVFVGSIKPDDFFQAVDRYGVDWTQTSPALLRTLTDAVRGAQPRCPGLDAVYAVGGLMTPAQRDRIRTRLSPNLYSRYGSTETGMLSIAGPQDLLAAPSSVGQIVPWVHAEVVDENDVALPPGKTGILRFRTPESPGAYFDDPEASAKVFRDGWVYLGDVGSIDRNGMMTLRGRADEVINVGGVKVNPVEVEAVVAAHPSIADVGVFATQSPSGATRLVAAAIVREGFDEKSVLAHCQERLGPVSPARVVPVSELPRNAAGKLMRRELSQRFRMRRAQPAAGDTPSSASDAPSSPSGDQPEADRDR